MFPIDIIFLVYCIYVPILILLYVAQVIVILKPGTPFKSSFYMLFVASAAVDLIMVGATVHEFRMVLFPLVNGMFEAYDCGACSRTRIALSYICPFAQDLLNFFIAVNRLTSIQLTVHHARIWRKLLPIAICVSYCLPVATYAYPALRNAWYTRVDLPEYTIYAVTSDDSFLPWWNAQVFTSIEMVLLSVIILVIYSIAGRSLRKLVQNTESAKQERTLLKFGVVNLIITIPCIFLQIIAGFAYFPKGWTLTMIYQYGWIIDVKCFSASITMMIVNSTFRNHFLSVFGIKRTQSSSKDITISVLNHA